MSRSKWILPIATVSGAAGLIYEVGWSRAFSLSLGAEVAVLSGLLAGFLGGLAVGAWLGGRWAPACAHPLRVFAGLEAATALSGALVLPGLSLTEPLFQRLYVGHLQGGDAFLLPAVSLACLWILPATVFMGATFPVLVEALRREGARTGRSAGLVYGWNTAGAVAGALCTGLLLLPRLGLTGSLLLAAGLNLLAAGGAIGLRARASRPSRGGDAGERLPAGAAAGHALLGAVTLVGIASMLDQIGWTRVLSMLLGSTVYGFSVILAAFLSGLAFGGFVGARACERAARPARRLIALYTGVGLSGLAAVAVLGRLAVWLVPPLAGAAGGLRWLFPLQFAASFGVVAVPTFLMGAAFPLAVHLRAGGRRSGAAAAGQVYAASSAGLVLGSLAAGGWALPALGVYGALIAAAIAMPIAAILVAFALGSTARRAALRVAAACVVATAVAAWLLPSWDAAVVTSGPFLYAPLYRAGARAEGTSITEAIRGRGTLVFDHQGADATVSVRLSPVGTRSLQINGKTDGSTGGDMVSQLLAGHLPAILGPPPSGGSALLIGLATGVSLRALEAYPLGRIDTVELLPGVVEAAALFREANGNALDDQRLRLIVGDARNHLRYAPDRYDLITSQPTNPWIAGSAALFTRETFLAARRRLNDDGVFCQWVQGYGMRPEDLESVIRTFLEVFPEASLWEESPTGGDYFLVGRNGGPLLFDPAAIEARLQQSADGGGLRQAGIEDVAGLLSRFVTGPDGLRALAAGAPIQVDDRMALEYSSARALYEETLPGVVRALRRHRESPAAWITDLSHSPVGRTLLRALRRSRTQARREERFLLSFRATDLASITQPDLAIGVELLRAGLPGPARPHLERALASTPAAPQARALLGAMAASEGDLDTARRHLAEAVRLRPDDIGSLLLLARIEIESGDLDEAARHLEAAPSEDADDPDLLNLIGALSLLRDRPQKAERVLDRALEEDPGLAEAWVNLGVARRRNGDLSGALSAYERALDIDPDNADARFNLAVGLLLDGKRDAAIRELEHILTADPADASARLRLAEIFRGADRPVDEKRELRALLDWAPDSEEAATARSRLGL